MSKRYGLVGGIFGIPPPVLDELGVYESKWGISDITNKGGLGRTVNPKTMMFTDPHDLTKNVGGYAVRNPLNGKVSVHISTRASMNPILLKGLMIHEFTHAYHMFLGYDSQYSKNIFRNSTENSATNAQRTYYEGFKSNTSYMLKIIDKCNSYQSKFQNPQPLLWDSPFSGFKVVYK